MNRIACFLLLFPAVLFFACNEQKPVKKPAAVEEIPAYDPNFSELPRQLMKGYSDSAKQFFHSTIGNSNFSGQFLVAKNGEIVFEHYQGTADAAGKLPVSAKIPFHVASISKTVTAVAVLRLVDQKKIRLDHPVGYYLKGFPFPEITVRTLLNHRSGLPYYGYFTEEMWPHALMMRNKDLLEILNSGKITLNFPPDTHFAYCNTNYAVLALIVEKVTRKRFPKAMNELIFEPLDMNSSFIFEPSKRNSVYAKSYNSKGVLQGENHLDLIYGDKNLYTTARDLLKFDKGTYSDEFLSKAMKAEMFKGYSYEKEGKANYGLGIRMREEAGKKTYFFHTGWWHGNTGCYATMRSDTVCMVILSNQYTRRIFAVNQLSLSFGDYPFSRAVQSIKQKIQKSYPKK